MAVAPSELRNQTLERGKCAILHLEIIHRLKMIIPSQDCARSPTAAHIIQHRFVWAMNIFDESGVLVSCLILGLWHDSRQIVMSKQFYCHREVFDFSSVDIGRDLWRHVTINFPFPDRPSPDNYALIDYGNTLFCVLSHPHQ